MSVDRSRYHRLHPDTTGYVVLLLVLLVGGLTGGYCAYNLEHSGHIISAMNNRIVWGLPHVFAISLIVTASGALNGATLGSVFGIQGYKRWARLSVAVSLVFLLGGLMVLVLDLGRPDRLFIAMTTYNFRSIFSWNIFLYTGFMVVCLIYLWVLFERRFNKRTKSVGLLALAWRIVLTSGTGAIFGFLVGRSSLDSAVLPPLFIALSFVMGSSVLALVMMMVSRWQGTVLPVILSKSLAKFITWCLVALVYFSLVYHLTNLYAAEHHSDEHFVLAGPHALLFWLGHIGFGVGLPVWLLVRRSFNLLWACCLALIGGMILVYLIVIGSQSTPQVLFPGKTVIASSFGDAGIAHYFPSLWEWGLGLGGVSVSLLLLLLILRVLPITPDIARD